MRSHLHHHQRIAYTPGDETTSLGEIGEQRYHAPLAAENLQPPSCEYAFCAPDQIRSTELSPRPLVPTRPPQAMRLPAPTPGSTPDSSSHGPPPLPPGAPLPAPQLKPGHSSSGSLQYLQIDPQLSQHWQFSVENPTLVPVFFPPVVVGTPGDAPESNSTQPSKPVPPMRQQTSTVMVDSSPLSSPTPATMGPADPLCYHHLSLNARPPTSESTGNELPISPGSQAATARAEDIVKRENSCTQKKSPCTM